MKSLFAIVVATLFSTSALAAEIPQCQNGATIDDVLSDHEAYGGVSTKIGGEEAQAIKDRVFASVKPPLWLAEMDDLDYVVVTMIPELNSVVFTFVHANGCFAAEIWFPLDEGTALAWERGF